VFHAPVGRHIKHQPVLSSGDAKDFAADEFALKDGFYGSHDQCVKWHRDRPLLGQVSLGRVADRRPWVWVNPTVIIHGF
jgi:hypothetical protein